MPIRIARRFGRALRRAPWLDIEFWSGFAAIGWGVVSLTSSGTFTDRPAWSYLGQHVSPPAVEILSILVGGAQWLALFSHGRLPRWAASFAAALLWSALTAVFILGDRTATSIAPSIALYIALAGMNMTAMGRAANGDGAGGRYA